MPAPAWAVAALMDDPARPDIGPVAVVAVAPLVTVHTCDPYPGAEPVDTTITTMLWNGFELVAALNPAALTALPHTHGWLLTLAAHSGLLRITGPDGVLYTGDLGGAEIRPRGWHQAVRRHGLLVVLVASNISPFEPVHASMERACKAGNVVGALLAVGSVAPTH